VPKAEPVRVQGQGILLAPNTGASESATEFFVVGLVNIARNSPPAATILPGLNLNL
jgi:hypothetical protein